MNYIKSIFFNGCVNPTITYYLNTKIELHTMQPLYYADLHILSWTDMRIPTNLGTMRRSFPTFLPIHIGTDPFGRKSLPNRSVPEAVYFSSNKSLNNPFSICFANRLFSSINPIGPKISPNTPAALNPAYIANSVTRGCIPNCVLTNFWLHKLSYYKYLQNT